MNTQFPMWFCFIVKFSNTPIKEMLTFSNKKKLFFLIIDLEDVYYIFPDSQYSKNPF